MWYNSDVFIGCQESHHKILQNSELTDTTWLIQKKLLEKISSFYCINELNFFKKWWASNGGLSTTLILTLKCVFPETFYTILGRVGLTNMLISIFISIFITMYLDSTVLKMYKRNMHVPITERLSTVLYVKRLNLMFFTKKNYFDLISMCNILSCCFVFCVLYWIQLLAFSQHKCSVIEPLW